MNRHKEPGTATARDDALRTTTVSPQVLTLPVPVAVSLVFLPRQDRPAGPAVRFNFTIYGEPAQWILSWHKRGLISNARDLLLHGVSICSTTRPSNGILRAQGFLSSLPFPLFAGLTDYGESID